MRRGVWNAVPYTLALSALSISLLDNPTSNPPEPVPTGEIACKQGGGTARMGIDPGVVAGVLGAGELVIPADSTSKRVEASLPGTKESLTITVLEVPATP